MSLLNKIITGAIIVFLCLFLYNVRSCVLYQKDKALWEQEKEQLTTEIDVALDSATRYETNAKEWQDKALEREEQVKEIRRELEEEQVAHARDLARIEHLTPTELVSQTIEALGVASSEITLTSEGVVFSLHATRVVLEVVDSLDFVRQIEIPSWKKIVDTKSLEIGDLNIALSEKDKALIEKDAAIAKLQTQVVKETKLRVRAEKMSMFSLPNVAITVGVAVVTGVGLFLLVK